MTEAVTPAARRRLGLLRAAACAAAVLSCTVRAEAPAQEPEADSPCGPVKLPGQTYGPFDYVTDRPRLGVVEQFHFTPKVEALIGGSSGYLGEDLSYTLNTFPNHHRALAAAMAYAARTHSAQPPYMRLSVECYFDRALRFRPYDTVVRTLFGIYLGSLNRVPEALTQLDAAARFAEDNGLSHHNIGMAYLDLGQTEAALREAHKAIQLGYPGTQLVERLKRANQWKEPSE